MAVGAYFVYLNVYYRQVGLTGTQIGIIAMSSSIIAVVSALAWGYISDRTGQPRLLMAFGAAGAGFLAQFVPLAHSFLDFYALACLSSLLFSPLFTLMDGITLVMLGSKSENYGSFRLGGSIGYILSAGISGFVYSRTSLMMIFPAYGVLMCLFAAIALLLPDIPVRIEARSDAQPGMIVRQPAWIIFAACVFLIWVANYAIMTYMGVSLMSMGGDERLVGLAATTSALVEIPFMAFSGWLIKRFGLTRLMVLAMLLMAIRYALLGWMPDPNWAIYINLLNGPAFGLFAPCAVAYAKKLAPPALTATAQGLLNSTASLAGVVSAILTGVLFDQIGPKGIFVGMAICCAAAIALFSVGAMRFQSLRAVQEAVQMPIKTNAAG